MPWEWVLRDETEPEAKESVSGAKGVRPSLSRGCEVARQKIMRPTRGRAWFRSAGSRGEGVQVACEDALGSADGGPRKQAASIRPCLPSRRPAEAPGLVLGGVAREARSISELRHSPSGRGE